MSGHLTKTDSEVSSQAQSSPARPGHVYYVQSPSRDSHDGEKTTNSFHSSPGLSPMGSPPHSHHSNSSLGPHSSRESSSTRISSHRRGKNHHGRKGGSREDGGGAGGGRPWKEFDAIEEEGLLGGTLDGNARSRRCCYFVAFVLGFVVLFSVFSLILWGASRPQRPKITMKSIYFDQFMVQAGSDGSGVATNMVSMNCTVRLTFRNTATFFGVHVTSTPLDLSYSELTIASGTMRKFYQSRKSQRSMVVTVKGSHIPIYGGGADLASTNRAPIEPVPFVLSLMVRSRAYVLGKLVKTKFYRTIRCRIVMDPKKMSVPVSLKNKCSYE